MAPGGRLLVTILVSALTATIWVLAAGCGGAGSATGRDESSGEERASVPSSAPEAGNGEETPMPEDAGDGFVASAERSGGTAGAADRIEGFRFQVFEGYERLLVDFGRDGGDAGVPRWSVERPPEGGYVRLRFPGVASTGTAHEGFVGSVLDEVYVVRDRDGGLFADVFAMHEFRYRVTELPESGRLAVDLRGVPEEIDLPPTTGDGAVVVQPREAEEIGSPIEVRGYARLFEGRVTVSLLDRERDVLASETVRANDWTEAWGLFETTIGFSGYEGLATLRVGSPEPERRLLRRDGDGGLPGELRPGMIPAER